MSKIVVEMERVCVQECDELRTELAESRAELAAREWQPIETAPSDGTEVLGYTIAGGYFVCWWHARRNELSGGVWIHEGMECYPTHWQPLPAPPSEGEVR